jgi:aspartate/tyrosine/aromatic aminotransferase
VTKHGAGTGAASVTVTYTAVPTSKEQCKDGGWKNFGTMFKNQGQCVKFVRTGR